MNMTVKRHGFISFWLYLGLVVNIISVIVYFLLLFSSKGLWTGTPEPTWLRIAWLLQSAALVFGYYLLLKWRKSGFYLIAGMIVAGIIINILTSAISVATFFPIIPCVILYLILQIKKDDTSYWDLMDYVGEDDATKAY